MYKIEVMFFLPSTIFPRSFFFLNFSYAINIHDMSEAFTIEKSKVKVKLRMSY